LKNLHNYGLQTGILCGVVLFSILALPAPAQDAPATPARPKLETAVFAGGCFWCTELAFEQLKGVVNVESGYSGDIAAKANYERVHRGTTKHAEVVRLRFDPAKISYDQLLDVFFAAHDPTQLNRQGEDVGKQYRSAIFYADDTQKRKAEAKIEALTQQKAYRRKIVTRLEPLADFYPAEQEHQDFARRYIYSPYIQGHAIPQANEVRNKFPDLIAPGR
jgi:methionine-S-sulfoxide reductase